MKYFSLRKIYSYGFLACIGLIVFALLLQYQGGLKPCPLCITQRVIFIGLAIVFAVAVLHRSAGKIAHMIYNALILLLSLFGVAAAGRQVWLQSLPPEQVPGCGPGLSYMLEHLPFWEVLRLVFLGSGDCAEVQWIWLGLSIPQWSLICFAGFACVALFNWINLQNLKANLE